MPIIPSVFLGIISSAAFSDVLNPRLYWGLWIKFRSKPAKAVLTFSDSWPVTTIILDNFESPISDIVSL